jgi:hypothetical protein
MIILLMYGSLKVITLLLRFLKVLWQNGIVLLRKIYSMTALKRLVAGQKWVIPKNLVVGV